MRANGIPIQTRAQTFLRALSLKGKEPGFLRREAKNDGSFFFFILRAHIGFQAVLMKPW